MGNLEKLGIMVMVILVVVVGVVAITPQERVAQALRDPSGTGLDDVSDLEVVPTPPRKVPRRREHWPSLGGEDTNDGTLRAANRGGDAQRGTDDGADAHERWRREFNGDNRGGTRSDPVDPAPTGEHRAYTLKADDRLIAIARSELGDGSRWPEILELNPSLDPRRLTVGVRILLPKRRAADVDRGTPRPGIKTYVVAEGDTLSSIAARELGTAMKWNAVVDANRDQLSAPEDLRVGMKLRIPITSNESAPRAAPEIDDNMYEVVRGDTLPSISSSLLGTPKRWREIMTLNGLRNADDIRPGMKLRIP